MRQTFNKPGAKRVRYKNKHDWNGASEFFDVDSTTGCHRNYRVGLQANQFLRECSEAIWIFGRKAMLEMYGFSFSIAEIVERFLQRLEVNVFFLGAACVPERANDRNFGC